jgi:DNA-binding CsgD family transcriptional regulator
VDLPRQSSLSISPNTVRNLLVVVRSRLGAANRAEIVRRAVFA